MTNKETGKELNHKSLSMRCMSVFMAATLTLSSVPALAYADETSEDDLQATATELVTESEATSTTASETPQEKTAVSTQETSPAPSNKQTTMPTPATSEELTQDSSAPLTEGTWIVPVGYDIQLDGYLQGIPFKKATELFKDKAIVTVKNGKMSVKLTANPTADNYITSFKHCTNYSVDYMNKLATDKLVDTDQDGYGDMVTFETDFPEGEFVCLVMTNPTLDNRQDNWDAIALTFDFERAEKYTDPVQTESADKSALQTAYNEIVNAQNNKDKYTTESLETINAFSELVMEAQFALANSRLEQEYVDDLTNRLNEQLETLVLRGDKTELISAIETAEGIEKGKFSDDAWNALQDAIAAAKTVNDNIDATEADVKDAVESLNNAVRAFEDSYVDRDALQSAYDNACAILNDENECAKYTTKSSQDLRIAAIKAMVYLSNSNLTKAQAEELTDSLTNAMDALVLRGDKTELASAIETAEAIEQGKHTDEAWTALQSAIAAANEVNTNIDATEADVKGAVESLNNAVDAFNDSATTSDLDKMNLADGIYSIDVAIMHTNRKQPSMANNAIEHTVKLEVVNGEYFVTFDLKGISIGTSFGYLKSLAYYEDGYTFNQYGIPQGKRVDAQILSTQKDSDGNDLIDAYNKDDGSLYPDLTKIKLAKTAITDEEGYAALHVFVPIMEAIAAGNGDQDALLKVDWSTLKVAEEGQFPEAPITDWKQHYSDVLKEVNAITNDDGKYSTDSFAAFKDYISGAKYDKSIYANFGYDFSSFEYKNLCEGIKYAKSLLNTDPNHTYYQDLEQLVSELENLDQSKYTEESWNEFQKRFAQLKSGNRSLEKAKEQEEKGNGYKEVYKRYLSDYNNARAQLVTKEQIILTDEKTGATLTCSNDGAITKDCTFHVDVFDANNWQWDDINHIQLSALNKTCAQYAYYQFIITDAEGKRITPDRSFSITLPVPENIDMDNLTIDQSVLFKNDTGTGSIAKPSMNKEERTLTLSYTSYDWFYSANGSGVALKNPITAVDPSTLENGVYSFTLNMVTSTDAAQASMANSAINHEAYLVKNGDVIDVYIDFVPFYISESPSYCGGFWSERGGSGDNDWYKNSLTVLDYYTNADGTIQKNNRFDPITEVACPKTAKLRLERECFNKNNGYTLVVSAPDMTLADANYSDLILDQLTCSLTISNAQKLGDESAASSYLPGFNRSALKYQLQYASIFQPEEFTIESYANLTSAVAAAQTVYDNVTSTSADYEAQIGALKNAISQLKEGDALTEAKTALEAAIATAEQVEKGNKTQGAYNTLKSAITAAKNVLTNTSSNVASLTSAVKTLQTAVDAFNTSEEASTLDKDNLADGIYSISADMIKTDRVSKSMADNAISHTAKLEVKDGEYFITLDFRGITIENRFGYLKDLSYYADGYTYGNYGTIEGNLVAAEVLSTQKDSDGNDVIDQYNDANSLYPDLVRIKLAPQAIKDADGYVPLHVFVPIMEAIAAGNGDQDVLMKLDWSTLKTASADDPNFKPEDPVEQSPAMDVTDAATGVKIHADKGVFAEGTNIVVNAITSGSEHETATKALSDVSKKFSFYRLQASDSDGNEVAPNGPVTISLPIPSGYDASKLALYRINADGSKTLIQGTASNGAYTFATRTMANFALVEKASATDLGSNKVNTNVADGKNAISAGNGSRASLAAFTGGSGTLSPVGTESLTPINEEEGFIAEDENPLASSLDELSAANKTAGASSIWSSILPAIGAILSLGLIGFILAAVFRRKKRSE